MPVLLRHPQGRPYHRRRREGRAQEVGQGEDRPLRHARLHPGGAQPAQDQVRQDHAKDPKENRQGRRGHRRHLDLGGRGCRRDPAKRPPGIGQEINYHNQPE